ncbi:leucine-rich repeat domain-containing protein [Mycoplasma sp. AC157]
MKILTKKESLEILKQKEYFQNAILDLSSFKDLEIIDELAFATKGIEKVIFPENLKIIKLSAFMNCTIKEIVWNNKIEIIEDSAFETNFLEKTELPSSLKEIKSFAFADNQLEKISIPAKIEIVEESAFENNDLLHLEFNNENLSITFNPFWNNPNIETLTFNLKQTFIQDSENKGYKKISIKYIEYSNSKDFHNISFIDFNLLNDLMKYEDFANIKEIIFINDKTSSSESIEIYFSFNKNNKILFFADQQINFHK